ncbi:hemolysin III family protein [Bifidobacterium sp. SMB2]|uniref:Hemolysin III family protein n=1 Tax=Bifidobacterium saimiriisciurei TaxID=2661627 RepID=A0ABX0C971_9BIFI|nr:MULTISPECIES: hemolysin III family protein [Bifidobacterium]NEG96116.1 hemolysin III family protein [Bifidobacterium sp. SMB2]NEH10806.1 hemolysin III family protein [Bifidobacterium saimiriisciurei]
MTQLQTHDSGEGADDREQTHEQRLEQTRQAVRAAFLKDRQAKADEVRARAKAKAERVLAKGELKARRIENKALGIRRVRFDVHGRPKPLMRGWIHAFATPLALAAGIVLICLSSTAPLKWACAVFMTCSLILFGNSACYHLGDWSPKVTDVLRRIDHVNIFLLIAGTYTPVSFALEPFWRDIILIGIWSCTLVALLIHVVWISAPRWLYTIVYIIFGVSGAAYLGLFWRSPAAGPVVVWLIVAGGICYIAGAIVYGLRRPDPWPKVFGFHEIFHCGTVAGYACHMVAIYFVIVALM